MPERDSSITGCSAIDSLQVLQRAADLIDDPDAKLAFVTQAYRLVSARDLLGRVLFVSSGLVLAHQPDTPPNEGLLLSRGLTFTGELTEYNYLMDDDIPLDSLTATFQRPSILEAMDDDDKAYRRLILHVPVAAIDACVDLASL